MLPERLTGRILLQVESHGEAWYVNQTNLKRYYLGRPSDAAVFNETTQPCSISEGRVCDRIKARRHLEQGACFCDPRVTVKLIMST